MIYIIDHKDSFTHNVVHQFERFDDVACDNYNDGTYYDWFLPSKSEANLLYSNIGPGAITGTNTAGIVLLNIGNFYNYYYWTSTNDNPNNTINQYNHFWSKEFSSGGNYSWNFNYSGYRVRAIRAF